MQEGTNIVKEKEKKEAFQKTCYKKYVLNYALKQNPYGFGKRILPIWNLRNICKLPDEFRD